MEADNIGGKKKKMRVVVYAIAKNEEHFAERWAKSMSEADCVVCLDTGSTDKTVEILRANGVHVEIKKIDPWRFDVARNESLKLCPTDADVCVCTDLDEEFEPGWRMRLEEAWRPGYTRGLYRFTWNFNPDGSEGVVFNHDKIHLRRGYRWVGPVHETLVYDEPLLEVCAVIPGIQLNHRALPKSSRANYLPLLELAVEEDPHNDRYVHYLGREYFYHGRYKEAINVLMRHLELPTALWDAERAASMRIIAKCYAAMALTEKHSKALRDSSELWLCRSIAEAPQYREGYVEMQNMAYEAKKWNACIYYGEAATRILDRPLSYICEASAWGSLPYDLLSIAYWNIGNIELAIKSAELALSLDPTNERIRDNINLMKSR